MLKISAFFWSWCEASGYKPGERTWTSYPVKVESMSTPVGDEANSTANGAPGVPFWRPKHKRKLIGLKAYRKISWTTLRNTECCCGTRPSTLTSLSYWSARDGEITSPRKNVTKRHKLTEARPRAGCLGTVLSTRATMKGDFPLEKALEVNRHSWETRWSWEGLLLPTAVRSCAEGVPKRAGSVLRSCSGD